MLVSAPNPPSALDPAGPEAQRIADIWWVMLAIGLVIYAGVMVLLAIAARRRRTETVADGQRLIVLGGVVVPAVALGALTVVSTVPSFRDSDEPEYTIEVEGRQYWWEVRYPEQGIVTANEIRIPAGQPVLLLLTSDDVIHSLWVPQLGGKLDLLPERTTRLVLEAHEPGVFRGECAEFCGTAHAHMQLLVVAETAEDHERWLAAQAEDGRAPESGDELRGRDVFLGSCAYCHTVRGTNATSDVGPDLTHFASRLEIGAGVMENEPAQLAEWIVATQRHKPGNLMPSFPLAGEDLQALIAYLESLE